MKDANLRIKQLGKEKKEFQDNAAAQQETYQQGQEEVRDRAMDSGGVTGRVELVFTVRWTVEGPKKRSQSPRRKSAARKTVDRAVGRRRGPASR